MNLHFSRLATLAKVVGGIVAFAIAILEFWPTLNDGTRDRIMDSWKTWSIWLTVISVAVVLIVLMWPPRSKRSAGVIDVRDGTQAADAKILQEIRKSLPEEHVKGLAHTDLTSHFPKRAVDPIVAFVRNDELRRRSFHNHEMERLRKKLNEQAQQFVQALDQFAEPYAKPGYENLDYLTLRPLVDNGDPQHAKRQAIMDIGNKQLPVNLWHAYDALLVAAGEHHLV
jgi:hypothetical protein